jgi:hypothetical protein
MKKIFYLTCVLIGVAAGIVIPMSCKNNVVIDEFEPPVGVENSDLIIYATRGMDNYLDIQDILRASVDDLSWGQLIATLKYQMRSYYSAGRYFVTYAKTLSDATERQQWTNIGNNIIKDCKSQWKKLGINDFERRFKDDAAFRADYTTRWETLDRVYGW